MKKIFLNRHDEPYKSIQAARVGAGHLKNNKGIDSAPVPYENGFGLEAEVEDTEEEMPRRPKRVPISTRNVLTAPKRDGFKRRFVNIDEEKEGWDRVERFQNAGYSIVEGDVQIGNKRIAESSQKGSAVIRSVGGGLKGILMEIKNEWYKEDKAEKQAAIDNVEQSMMVNETNPGDGMYGKVEIGPHQ